MTLRLSSPTHAFYWCLPSSSNGQFVRHCIVWKQGSHCPRPVSAFLRTGSHFQKTELNRSHPITADSEGELVFAEIFVVTCNHVTMTSFGRHYFHFRAICVRTSHGRLDFAYFMPPSNRFSPPIPERVAVLGVDGPDTNSTGSVYVTSSFLAVHSIFHLPI